MAVTEADLYNVVYFLGEFINEDIKWFVDIGEKRLLSQGEFLIQAKCHPDSVYILLFGELSVVLFGSNGEEKEIARLTVGEMVGELSFLEDSVSSASVKARENAVVLALPIHKLRAKLNQDKAFSIRFYRAVGVLLATRLRRTVTVLGHPSKELEAHHAVSGWEADTLPDLKPEAPQWFDMMRSGTQPPEPEEPKEEQPD